MGKESPSSLQASPRTTTTTSNSSTSTSNSSNGVAAAAPPPLTPKAIPRSDNNPYPTTFVQADTSSFKQVVQMLTGSTDTAAKHHHHSAASDAPPPLRTQTPPAAKTGPKKPAFKLYERRHNSFKNLKISPLIPGLLGGAAGAGISPRKQPEILSPSVLDFPSLVLSPVTPLIPDPFNRPPPHHHHHHSSAAAAGVTAEERAIAEKGFYLHPSLRAATPRDAEPPRLLPLFPVTSPKATSST